jgi:flagellar basal body-associated protein FliL
MVTLSQDERGMNVLLIPLILVLVFFLTALGFSLWSYSSRQDYKNNTDQKVNTAVELAKKETATQKDNEFIEREKQPLKEYRGPGAFGGIVIRYPKTWSAYIDESGKGSSPVNGYFYPNYVPATQSDTNFAFRLEVVNKAFDEELRNYDVLIKNGKIASQPYKPVNVPNIVGIRLDGEIVSRKQGVLILIPLRDKTIRLWVESDQFKNDYFNNVLPNFSFTP